MNLRCPQSVYNTLKNVGKEQCFLKKKKNIYIYIYIYVCIYYIYVALPHLRFATGDLIPQPRINPGFPSLGAWSLSHWSTREVPRPMILEPK